MPETFHVVNRVEARARLAREGQNQHPHTEKDLLSLLTSKHGWDR